MSTVSSVTCPLCSKKDQMMEDYDEGEVFYHCHSCGYGNLFKPLHEHGQEIWNWDRRCERRKDLKWVNVKNSQGLIFTGKVPLYPIGAEFPEYMVYPKFRKGKLVWKLYSEEKKHLGDYKTLGDAFSAGDKYDEKNR